MRTYIYLLGTLLCWPAAAHAAEKYFHGHVFDASVVSSSPCPEESGTFGGSFIRVREGQEYSIVVRNPLPVRVAAAVTVDGLNSIDGKRTTPEAAQKWIIEPHSSITISGWQTNDSNARQFYFTRAQSSYSNWKGKRDGRDYSPNLGIIGVAYFWNSSELQAALYPAQPFRQRMHEEREFGSPAAGASMDSMAKSSRAGTGMGHTQWNPVTRVNFYYDTGMYSASDALTIRYEFGTHPPRPLPFEDPRFEYRYPGNFTPEM